MSEEEEEKDETRSHGFYVFTSQARLMMRQDEIGVNKKKVSSAGEGKKPKHLYTSLYLSAAERCSKRKVA